MLTVFRNARLIDPESTAEKSGHLVVRDGQIDALVEDQEAPSPEGAEIVECNGKCLAPGIVDIGVKIGEPGERHKESFRSAGLAAAAGGVTTMVTRADTVPTIDSPEVLEFALRRGAEASPVRIAAMAALTRAREGREMVEIGFLQDAGAVAFSDGDRVTRDTKVLSRCLTYARSLGALVIGHPQEPGLSAGAATTSGKFAALRGLPSVSPMAERMGLDRDIALVEMTGARYHADQITAARALPPLERARQNGFDVTAGVSIHHLTLNALDVGDYRTFFKVKPPLRDEDDRLPAAMRLYRAGALSLPQLFRAMALNPARRLDLPGGRLTTGPADLVLFDPDAPFVLDRFALRSKSKNTPFDGQRMEGRVIGTWVGGRRVFDRYAA